MPQRNECVKTPEGVSRTRMTIKKHPSFHRLREDICDTLALFKRASSFNL